MASWGFMRELVRNPFIIATLSGLIANLLGFRFRLDHTDHQPHRWCVHPVGFDGRWCWYAVRHPS